MLGDPALVSLISAQQLGLICDVKEAMDEQFFKLSRAKLLTWLRYKIHCFLNSDACAAGVKKVDVISWILSYVPFKQWVEPLLQEAKEATKKQKKVNAEEDEEDEEDVQQTEGDAAGLAMSVMLADAQANNEAPDYDFRAADKEKEKKKQASKAKPAAKPSAAAMKFWAKQSTRSATKAKANGTAGTATVKKSASKKAVGGKRKRG